MTQVEIFLGTSKLGEELFENSEMNSNLSSLAGRRLAGVWSERCCHSLEQVQSEPPPHCNFISPSQITLAPSSSAQTPRHSPAKRDLQLSRC